MQARRQRCLFARCISYRAKSSWTVSTRGVSVTLKRCGDTSSDDALSSCKHILIVKANWTDPENSAGGIALSILTLQMNIAGLLRLPTVKSIAALQVCQVR